MYVISSPEMSEAEMRSEEESGGVGSPAEDEFSDSTTADVSHEGDEMEETFHEAQEENEDLGNGAIVDAPVERDEMEETSNEVHEEHADRDRGISVSFSLQYPVIRKVLFWDAMLNGNEEC